MRNRLFPSCLLPPFKNESKYKPFKWKWVWFTWKWAWDRVKRIIIWMVHVDSSLNRGKRLTRWRSLPCYFPLRYTRIISPPAILTWCRHQSNLNNCLLGAKPKYKAVIYKVGRSSLYIDVQFVFDLWNFFAWKIGSLTAKKQQASSPETTKATYRQWAISVSVMNANILLGIVFIVACYGAVSR